MYEHTQRSPMMLLLMLGASVVPVALLARRATAMPLGARVVLGVVVLVMLLSALVFSSLTISVGDGRLAWHFGPGVVRKSVALADIAGATRTTTTFLEGWGIHLTFRGWLYNIAGRQAVLVTLRDGRRFMLGTDEPDALVLALARATDTARGAAPRAR